MNTIKIVVTFALMLAGLGRSHAQLETSTVQVIKELPALPPLALPLMEASEVPESGTFYSVQRTNFPPLPFCPIPGLPVYLLETTASGSPWFVYDDRAVDYEAREREQLALRELRATARTLGLETEFVAEYGAAAGLDPGGDNPPMALMSYGSNELWLEITGVTNDEAAIIVHGTVTGESYALLSREHLTNAAWAGEQVIEGAAGQDWTPATVAVGARTNQLFFWTVSLKDSDGDFMPAFWELANGLDPNNPADAGNDPDGDGYTNQEEYLLGQDPHVADPPPPTITVAATDPNAGEPDNPGVVTFTRTGDTTRSLTIYYAVQGSARPGTDYQALSGQALFAVGQSTATVTIQPVDDQNYEGVEDLTLQVLPSVHYLNATNALATVTIADNEVQPVRVWTTSDEVIEGSGTNGAFHFLRDGDTRLPLTVNYTLTGTATNGVIYQTLPTSITFAPDASTTNLTVIPINNTNYSGSTTSILTLLPNAAYLIATNAGSDELVFVDDDLPVVNLVATDADAREAGLNPGRFTITRTGTTQEALAVTYRISDTVAMGNASYPQNYQALSNVVIIPVGQGSAFVDITSIQDTNSEPMETVTLMLAGGDNYRIGVSNAASVNIDDDEPLTYLVTVERPAVIGPEARPGIIHITRTGSALAASSVAWSVTDTNGTPMLNGTYSVTGDFLNGNLYFAANDSTATVNIMHASPATLAMQFRFAGKIATVPCWGGDRLFRIYTVNTNGTEGDPGSNARFVIARRGNGPNVQVKLRIEGTATMGVDYPSNNLQTITFSNNFSQTIDVYAYADGVTEGWESVIVRLDTSDLNYTYYNPSVSPTDFQETYAVLWLNEYGTPNPKPEVDTDGDLLTDAFEVAHGMNPLMVDDYQTDADKDGLSLLEEQYAGTNPALADSDGDGVNDFFELSRGSNPTNPLDAAVTPPAGVKVNCVVGDDSGSLSERWQLVVGSFTANNAAPGQVITRTITLKEGTSNVVRLQHLSSKVAPPDFDYRAELLSGDAAPPAFFVRDPQQLLGTHSDPGDGTDYASKTAVVIVPKIELTWTNKGDNLPLDMNTNGSNGEVRGQRIFAGAKTPTENLARNTVLLKIKTTPPLVGSNVWLRSFDVDDTTDDRILDNSRIIDPNGRAGGDNFYLFNPPYGYGGLFVTNNTSSVSVVLDSNGKAAVEMRVGMQPGDNYRIAATVFPTNNLNTLQSSNAAGNGYVSTHTDVIRSGFNGALSPLLTVWRKLHLEIDSMTAPPTSGPEVNFIADKVFAVKPNKPNAGQTTVYFGFRNPPWQINQFENGTLTVTGATTNYAIVGSGSEYYLPGYQNFAIVTGVVPANLVNTSCALRDDDDLYLTNNPLYPSTLGLQSPPLPLHNRSSEFVDGIGLAKGLRYAYLPVFIEVVDINALGWNAQMTIPFRLNQRPVNLDSSSYFDNGNLSLKGKDRAEFWAYSVVFGYQPDEAQDGDPNTAESEPLMGGSPYSWVTGNSYGYSAIYAEAIREQAFRPVTNPAVFATQDPVLRQRLREQYYYDRLFSVVAHEIGHAPGQLGEGDDHAEAGVMLSGAGSIVTFGFSPKSVKRFRSGTTWTQE